MKIPKLSARVLKVTAVAAAAIAIAVMGEYPRLSSAVGVHATEAAVRADFRSVAASMDAQRVADWAVHAADHEGLPFIVVDKRHAKTYVFDRTGALIDWTPALLGMGLGDDFEPGVVEMNMYETQPHQRITPAGRFKAEEWQKPNGEWILWLDYSTQIALHKLRRSQLGLSQEREARLYSSAPQDNRVTYGCVNVPPEFYDRVITPTFNKAGGVVYVLPESAPVEVLFTPRGSRSRA